MSDKLKPDAVYIVRTDGEGNICKSKVHETVDHAERFVFKSKLRFLFYCLLNYQGVYSWLTDTVRYALIHSESLRGYGSADVLMFEMRVQDLNLWKIEDKANYPLTRKTPLSLKVKRFLLFPIYGTLDILHFLHKKWRLRR